MVQQAALEPAPADALDLDALIAMAEELLRPVVAHCLATEPSAVVAAGSLVHDAAHVVASLLRDPAAVADVDQKELADGLVKVLGAAQAAPSKRVVAYHVRDAADAMMTTWIDVLDLGCDQHGEIELHPELMIPPPKLYPELYEMLQQALLPTVLLEEDAGRVMSQLRARFPADGTVELPLGLRVHLREGLAQKATRDKPTA